MINKAIEALTEIKTEAQKISDSYSLTNWKNKATNLMIRLYGPNSAPIEQIAELKYSPSFHGNNDNTSHRRKQADDLIDGLINEVKRFGLPDILKKNENGLSINITQSQNQETKVRLSIIIESIQEELTGNQLKELQEIIGDEKIKIEDKKFKILEKLKKFGSDVASNVLANILTNPTLYS